MLKKTHYPATRNFDLHSENQATKMAEVEKKAPGLPEEVPKDLRMELERLQRQIKVLLNNYQVGGIVTPWI